MSYKKFKNKSEIESKCTFAQPHSLGFEKKAFPANESPLKNNKIVLLNGYEDELLNFNSSSSSSLNEILFNSSNDKNANFPTDNICHGDMTKITSIPAALEKDETEIKSDDLKISKPCDDDVGGFDGIPSLTNCAPNENDQENIVDCLLDLDDYLKRMDDDCTIEDNIELSSERPNAIMAKINPSSVRLQKHTNAINPFERCSKLRRTIDCTMCVQNNSPEYEALSTQGTWNNETAKRDYHQHANNSDNVFIDVNGESSNVSAAIEEIHSSRSTNITGFELTNPCGQVLTNEQIFQNLIEQQLNVEIDRPRQYGRRAERASTFQSNLNDSNLNFTRINDENFSVNATTGIPEVRRNNEMMYTGSDGSTTRSSRNTTPVSIESTTDSGESLSISETLNTDSNAANHDNDQLASQSVDTDITETTMKHGFNSYWPHDHSRSLALISCTLGLFNTSRFATLTINYGGNFLIQFCILSIIFGIPFLWLQMSLGAKIQAGPISMWRISPICIGIGISITLVQYFITIYSTVALAWILKFIQDIFIHKTPYVWSESMYFPAKHQTSLAYSNLTESIPYYFNVNVLQRIKILKIHNENGAGFHINDHIAFYLVFVWAAVFLILCKGLKSFGKWILFLGVLPIVLLAAIAAKLLFIVDIAKLQNLLSSSDFDDFLVNSKTWVAAAQETFLTWGLLGASVIAISSRTHRKHSKFTLRKDAIFVVIVTFIGLALSALVGLCSVQVLKELDYVYVPGSYETPEHYLSIFSLKSANTGNVISYPTKLVPHYSTLVGEVYKRHTDTTHISGYQVLRFLTELLPAAVAVSTENMSWIWTLLLYIAFFLFGLSQLCVMWKPISCALGNSTPIIFETCTIGLLLSIPFVTELGITILHFMDILLGGAWFIPILWSAEIFGIFLIRGRPYNGDDLVNDLKMSGSMSAFLALSWNILLPIGLITLAIIEYKISQSSKFFHWRGKSYFNAWSRKAGGLIQIGFLISVPISAIIQICRYLTSGPPDILDRIQMLYRPLDEDEALHTNVRSNGNTSSSSQGSNHHSTVDRFQNDAPPKYTPPPSYTTATGAKLAKILRQSFRRSVRRLLGESQSIRPVLPIPGETLSEQTSDPATEETSMDISEAIEFESRPSVNFIYGRSLSLGRKQILNKSRPKETNGRQPSEQPSNIDSSFNRRSSYKLHNRPFTAEDVKTILRSSTFGRRVPRSAQLDAEPNFRSIENLVQNAEPPNVITEIVDEPDRNGENSTSGI